MSGYNSKVSSWWEEITHLQGFVLANIFLLFKIGNFSYLFQVMEPGLFKVQFIYQNFSWKTSFIRIFFLATLMGFIPCLNLVLNPIEGCDRRLPLPMIRMKSTKVLTRNQPMSVSDLNLAFRDLMAGNWLVQGDKALSIGRGSLRTVKVMRKLGFVDAIGVARKPCSSYVRRGNIYALPFNENSFDFVFSTAFISGARVPARIVLEMARVLKQGSVGVLLTRLPGPTPATTALVKAVDPLASYLKFSDIVHVRRLNSTVIIVFKKRFTCNEDDEDQYELGFTRKYLDH